MHVVALVLRATRRRHWTTAEAGRRRIERPKAEAPPLRRLRRAHEVTKRTVGGFPVWTVRPRTSSGTAAVYLHGGAYISGIAPQHWALIGRLADVGVRVEVPLYGLAPAAHVPGGLSVRRGRLAGAGAGDAAGRARPGR